MSNLNAIVRATRASGLASKAMDKFARRISDAENNLKWIQTYKANGTLNQEGYDYAYGLADLQRTLAIGDYLAAKGKHDRAQKVLANNPI